MANEEKALEAEKQELVPTTDAERTRDFPCFVPRADIYETESEIVVLADLPGADENTINLTLEKNVLTLNSYLDPGQPEGCELVHAEYEPGDFQRSFTLSDEIDRDGIVATITKGVLRLHLPKVERLRTKIIDVQAG